MRKTDEVQKKHIAKVWTRSVTIERSERRERDFHGLRRRNNRSAGRSGAADRRGSEIDGYTKNININNMEVV